MLLKSNYCKKEIFNIFFRGKIKRIFFMDENALTYGLNECGTDGDGYGAMKAPARHRHGDWWGWSESATGGGALMSFSGDRGNGATWATWDVPITLVHCIGTSSTNSHESSSLFILQKVKQMPFLKMVRYNHNYLLN